MVFFSSSYALEFRNSEYILNIAFSFAFVITEIAVGSKILVTGAGGFIGCHVVNVLVQQKEDIRILLMPHEKEPPHENANVEVVRGDIRDEKTLETAVCGTKRIIHLAGYARAWPQKRRIFDEINIHAVEALLAFAKRYDIQRIVHVSTILTRPPYKHADLPIKHCLLTPYEVSKRAGEALVDSYVSSGRDAIIIHPTNVYGPGPLNDSNGVTKAIDLYMRGVLRFRLADNNALRNYVYVKDVADGIVRALRYGFCGRHYILGGENASFKTLLDLVTSISGILRRTIAVRPPMALCIAHAAELLWRTMGASPPITRKWIRVFLEDRRVNSTLAIRDFRYHTRMLLDGLNQTINWLQERNASV